MATCLEVIVTLPTLHEDVVKALSEHMEEYSNADAVVVESNTHRTRIAAEYSHGVWTIDFVSDDALSSIFALIAEFGPEDYDPKKVVVTIKELMP